MTTEQVLNTLLTAQGRTVRSGQEAAARHIDSGERHVAAMCPTGVGKSALAVAASVANGGGVIAVNSNGLVAQYVAEMPEWSEALGVSVAALVGRAHYWCPVASPTLAGFPAEAKAHVQATGTFIGSGVDKAFYTGHSVVALDPAADDEDGDSTSPCTECPMRKGGGCPLWAARDAAGQAQVVITNATMLGVSIIGATDWAKAIQRPVTVLDEADSCREPLATVLGAQFTVRGAASTEEALEEIRDLAEDADDNSKRAKKARAFLARKRFAEAEGRKMITSFEDDKVVLSIPADLKSVFADRKVIAMSATLSQRNVDDLGLATTVANFQGLDVSASRVIVQDDAPAWKFSHAGPPAAWVAHVANELTEAFRNGGRTLGLFQSNKDLDAVKAALPADVRQAILLYSSRTDRTAVVKTYTAAPEKHLLVGLVQGAGRGLNLPGDLLRKVIVSRVPQNAPKDADRAVWAESSRADITQSVGRGHRHADDWCHVTIVGGFDRRHDVAEALTDLGWNIGS